ncbi:MAG: tRNA (adenosine(37)-N6)-threonylcarbamoyltransferase complex transferase subunit TsaD [Candidatus Kapabacteria bacterium]|nr:tRNA (adenosine(37)-N6)-threonylcarbamoyltransferase complex transferase subunit TsaD [Candidatus Kapabacteria bacterium]
MKILAIESSCDETSAAVIADSKALSNLISSQYFHSKFGGVVPELASRAHLEAISEIVEDALKLANLTINDIDALAVTSAPGLVGSLIVGSNFAKGLSLKYNLPLVPVNHIEGHLYSGCLQDSSVKFPFISLVVSGGHTIIFDVKSYNEYLILGLTKDDAAGEAFDKTAKMLGLPYPGGPQIDKLAKNANPSAYTFPRSMINSGDYNFSFSGLKTSVRYFIAKYFSDGIPEVMLANIAASVQEAIVDVLVKKSIDAVVNLGYKTLIVSGGVSANSRLRSKMRSACGEHKFKFVAPELSLCMDNAAMIGFIAEKKLLSDNQNFHDLTFTVNPTSIRLRKNQ